MERNSPETLFSDDLVARLIADEGNDGGEIGVSPGGLRDRNIADADRIGGSASRQPVSALLRPGMPSEKVKSNPKRIIGNEGHRKYLISGCFQAEGNYSNQRAQIFNAV